MEVRRATADDADQVCDLLASGLGLDPTVLTHVRSRLGDQDESGCVTLVEAEGRDVLGVATYVVIHPLEYERPQARITAMAVSDAHRHQGVGRRLVAAVEDRAREANCFRVELTSDRDLVGAHRFWESVGYGDVGLRFTRPLHETERAAPAN